MSRTSYPLKLPASLKEAVQKMAKQDGVSLNQWIAITLAKEVGSVETAEEYFRRRVSDSKGRGLKFYLDMAPDEPPMPGDELPEDLKYLLKNK